MTAATLADFTDVLFAWVRDNDPRAEIVDESAWPVLITATWDGLPVLIAIRERRFE